MTTERPRRWPRVTAIVPVYNGGPTLRACIESLLALDYPRDRLQIVVVDNHSSDETAAVIREYPGVEYAFEGLRTSYAARNKGALRATGEILAFTDGDCIVTPSWVRAAVEIFLSDPRVHLLGGPVGVDEPETIVQRFLHRAGNNNTRASLTKGYFPTANLLVRADVFDRLGGFDERMASGGDLDFCWRARYAGYKLGFSEDSAVLHRHRDSLRSMYRQSFKYGYGSRVVRKKHRLLAAPDDAEIRKYFADTSVRKEFQNCMRQLGQGLREVEVPLKPEQLYPFLRIVKSSGFLAGALQADRDATLERLRASTSSRPSGRRQSR